MIVSKSILPIIVPDELAMKPQWLCSDPRDPNPKVPDKKFAKVKNYPPDGALTMEQALLKQEEQGKYIGFYVTEDDPYVVIDIDHLKTPIWPFRELPHVLSDLLRIRSYSEISPSGKGLRVIYKLSDPEGKKFIKGKQFPIRAEVSQYLYDKKWAQIGFGPPWFTVTQDITSFSVPRVTPISLGELKMVFRIKTKEKQEERIIVRENIDAFNIFRKKLMALPLDRNPRICRAYEQVTGEAYQHYDFWVRMLMSLHQYGRVTRTDDTKCFSLADEWSSLDEASYKGADAIEKHWDSFEASQNYNTVSYKTIIAVYNQYVLKWPVPKTLTRAQKDKGISPTPITSEYRNFEKLMNHYGIHIYADKGNAYEYYMQMDFDIVNDYFMLSTVSLLFNKYYGPFGIKEMIQTITVFAQDKGFLGMSTNKVQEMLSIFMLSNYNEVDLYKLYFDTPFEELSPEFRQNYRNFKKSTFQALFDCLILDPSTPHTREVKLYKKYYEVWWMGFLKNIFYNGDRRLASCVLLLTGPEQTYKTSHFLALLPPPFKKDIVTTTHGFGTPPEMRDTTKIASDCRILVWDEVEQFLDSDTESNFKKILDGMPQSIIDKYEVRPKAFIPQAIYGATSNQREFKLSAMGSRRLFHIPVKWVDTRKMEKLCWWPILQELKRKYDHKLKDRIIPWMLTDDELEYQSTLHVNIRSKSDIDLLLYDTFQFEKPFDNIQEVTSFQDDKKLRLLTLAGVKFLVAKYNPDSQIVKLKALQNATARACASYTKTKRREVEIDKPRCTIKNGWATQGPHRRLVLPPLREESAAVKALYQNTY